MRHARSCALSTWSTPPFTRWPTRARCAWARCITARPRKSSSEITRESYEQYYLDDRKYFEVSTLYDEFAKTWDQRRLPMRYQPDGAAVDVYRLWNERNGGERKSTVVPPG